MIITFVAVGKKYINQLNDFFKTNESFKDNAIVLTDRPNLFSDVKTVLYQNKVFSFFDKLLFSLRVCEEYREDVLYVDVDELSHLSIHEIIDQIDEKETSILFTIPWPPKNLDELDNKRWKLFKDIVKTDHKEIQTLFENVFFFPKTLPVSKLLYDLELLKPIFETMSILNEEVSNNIGGGEGLALSYLVKINNLKIKQLK